MAIIQVVEQGAYIHKAGSRYEVSKDGIVLESIPLCTVDKVALYGRVQISTQALTSLIGDGIDILFFSRGGRFNGMARGTDAKDCYTKIAQYDCSIDSEFSIKMARLTVGRKLLQSLEFLRKNSRLKEFSTTDARQTIQAEYDSLDDKSVVPDIMLSEARAAVAYFSCFADVLPDDLEWQGRNRRPPRDPANALLSLTYMMALGRIESAVHLHGLDTQIGFLHQLEYGRSSFALDLLEFFRVEFCDAFVVNLLRQELLVSSDFVHSPENGCRLREDKFKVYLREFADFWQKSSQKHRSAQGRLKQLCLGLKKLMHTHDFAVFEATLEDR